MDKIKTPRLIIKSLQVEDVSNKYIDWLNDIEINQYLEVRFKVHNYESCVEFIKKMQEDENEELFGIFTNDKNNEHIGNCKLGFINKAHLSADVSYLIGNKNFWGKGYATEMLRYFVDYGFENLGLEKITAGCYEHNRASMKVLMKTGFIVEDTLKDQVISNSKRQKLYIFGLRKDSKGRKPLKLPR